MNETETSIVVPEIHTIDEIFEKTLFDLRLTMSQRKFRKVIEDIRNKEVHFYKLDNFWKLKEIKVRCMMKIVKRKVENDGGKYKSTEYWMNRVGKILEEWQDKLDILEEKEEIDLNFTTNPSNHHLKDQIEVLNELLLQHLYNHAIISKGEHHIGDTSGYLTFGIKLIMSLVKQNTIRSSNEVQLNGKTLQVAQNFYYFMSSILIADRNFNTAIQYIEFGLQLGLRELCVRMEGEDFNQTTEE